MRKRAISPVSEWNLGFYQQSWVLYDNEENTVRLAGQAYCVVVGLAKYHLNLTILPYFIQTADCSTSSLAKFRVRTVCLDASYILQVQTHSAPSEVSCSVACLADSDCLTFGYDQTQGSCRLSSQCIPDTASMSGNCRSGSEGEVVYTTESM